jgi:hypothetical protein
MSNAGLFSASTAAEYSSRLYTKCVQRNVLPTCMVAVLCLTAFGQIPTPEPVQLDTGKVSGALTGSKNDISDRTPLRRSAIYAGDRLSRRNPGMECVKPRNSVRFLRSARAGTIRAKTVST